MPVDSLVKSIFHFVLRLCFDVEVTGQEHFHAAGDKVLIIANHVSYLDPPIIATFLPEKPAFAINVYQADKWYISLIEKVITLYRLDPLKPLSMKRLIQDLRQGAKVVVFPEGRITTSGGIMKIYEGTGHIIEKTGATILPVRIDGAAYAKVSRLRRKLRQRWFPKVRLTILPPVKFPEGSAVSARAIYDILTDAAFATSRYQRTLLAATVDAMRWHGPKHAIASDTARIPLNYRQLFTRAVILSEKLKSPLDGQRFVAMLLPNSLGALVTFFALQLLDKIPCMLNFSSGEANLLHAMKIAGARTVLTSRAFVEKGKLEQVIAALEKSYTILYLEDIRGRVSLADKIAGTVKARLASTLRSNAKPDDAAVILYTSGSEGVPKGVALSHANILANIGQVAARLDLLPTDQVFNAMPIFHSFGLTVGMLMPVVAGIPAFLYPSPLHYRIIPDLVYDTDSTIMLGTDTFYNGYARYANPYDFWNIRLAVAGAEKLKDSTRHLYQDKFRVNIVEGYGVTEASPVVACNTPMEHQAGTVGRAFPEIECRLEKVEGLERGGRLFIKGPNIMLGYLLENAPGEIKPHGEWYDTGDIVDIDTNGFITILGRAKRFAKIGGEMVSLMAVEELANGLLLGQEHAAVSLPDDRKGEQIILFTESQTLTRDMLVQEAKRRGLPEILLPKHVKHVESLPRLGTGKIDYPALNKQARL